MRITTLIAVVLIATTLTTTAPVLAQKTIKVRPTEIDEVLTNPGIGFTTFQRFNGDKLNPKGWTEGFPIEYQGFDGNLENENYPMTSIAYFRIYWKYIEPEMGKYRWDLIDKALETAQQRSQTLMLRIAPYGRGPTRDVPAWYRAMVGEKSEWLTGGKTGWQVDAEDPRYVKYFGDMARAMGNRYDGHPALESVDLSIVGFWGEGRGSAILTPKTRAALVNAYTDTFKKTPLVMLLTDETTVKYGLSQANVGWRVDCIGDLGFWAAEQDGWTHMYDSYPQRIINCSTKDTWKTAPVTLEICGTFTSWKQKQGYNKEDVKYIFGEALKWHISSFNAKSSPVLDEWKPLVDEWLKKMGYRFVLRRFTHPDVVRPNGKLDFTTWWDNKGVAPCYKNFLLALRLKNDKRTEVLVTEANIKTWLPGDNLYDDAVFIPRDMPTGEYDIQIGIVDKYSCKPKVKLAIEGREPDGWYQLGKIKVQD
ncbi:MAG: DUF4832 domain-containing protein [Planctomycetota bacterium]|jgi:hypothetical protein